jgi:hypothetical protein
LTAEQAADFYGGEKFSTGLVKPAKAEKTVAQMP